MINIYILNICRRWFSSSATTSRPCWSMHRCLGYWNMPGWVPFFPKQWRNFPLAVNNDIRWFPLSENIMFPSLLMAIPNGKNSSPGACPCFPNRLSGCPSGVNLQMQWLPRSATTTWPRLLIAIPAGYFRAVVTLAEPKLPTPFPLASKMWMQNLSQSETKALPSNVTVIPHGSLQCRFLVDLRLNHNMKSCLEETWREV